MTTPTSLSIPEQRDLLSIGQLQGRVELLDQMYKGLLQVDVDYGKIPGVKKPSLFKPGAELLRLWMNLTPVFIVDGGIDDKGHYSYQVICSLFYDPERNLMAGEGVGHGTTYESKYRYRDAKAKCPLCGKETIFKGKKGGWFCWRKQGGCGESFLDGNEAIEGQPLGKTENPDPADQANTVLKMAKKRAFIDAILTVTGASRIFTQDLEDKIPTGDEPPPPKDLGKLAKAKGPAHVEGEEPPIDTNFILSQWCVLGWQEKDYTAGKKDLASWCKAHEIPAVKIADLFPAQLREYYLTLKEKIDQLKTDSKEEDKGE